MALTVYEYSQVNPAGQPIEPATQRSAAVSLPFQLRADTSYVGVVSTVAANIRIGTSGSGETATSADYNMDAGKSYGFAVRPGARPWISAV